VFYCILRIELGRNEWNRSRFTTITRSSNYACDNRRDFPDKTRYNCISQLADNGLLRIVRVHDNGTLDRSSDVDKLVAEQSNSKYYIHLIALEICALLIHDKTML
jgi:hypothetical protein